ncbi:sigma-70 family RNA polymerase sigma factor [Porticoccaceae bacterium LTM1]|nr:sigma-70 family RNA polymerase sigma factor [Porticoccaceae bacterium LTM1]
MNLSKSRTNVVEFPSRSSETRKKLLDRLYDDHGNALRSFVGLRMGGHVDADDVVQDVFTKLAQMDNLKGVLPSEYKSERAYIFQMASNHIINLYRYRSVRRRYSDPEAVEEVCDSVEERSPERIVLAQHELEAVRKAIQKLPESCRQAFLLCRFKQNTYPEVAQQMGVSVKQVEKYMQKSLIVIRRVAKRLREAEK